MSLSPLSFETERLLLLPLTAEQLTLWVDDLPALERELAVTYQAQPMADWFSAIVRTQQKITADDAANRLFHTFWFLLRKTDRIAVGAADFKGPPNEAGEVEIGYGLGADFEHEGYMTEAVQAMCRWAFAQCGVLCVTAETEPDHSASQNVLRRCGFSADERKGGCWWRLTKT